MRSWTGQVGLSVLPAFKRDLLEQLVYRFDGLVAVEFRDFLVQLVNVGLQSGLIVRSWGLGLLIEHHTVWMLSPSG